MKAFLDWCFRSRVTGRITIAQFPNTALWLFLAASLAAWELQPGSILTVARVIAFGSGVYWAVDELLRGVNPWRRALGLTVLLFLLVDVARFGLGASARTSNERLGALAGGAAAIRVAQLSCICCTLNTRTKRQGERTWTSPTGVCLQLCVLT
jgi:hypothetical protein